MPSNKRAFISDCEGPISKNDNAFELSCHFIPNGDKFFALLSRYDDVLADVLKRPGYRAGNTLKLILPFLKAFGVTNQKMRNFSAQNIILVPGAKTTLNFVSSILPSYIVSTSYEHYIKALCDFTGFPFENTYCTKVDIDKYSISEEERQQLMELSKEIASMPMIEIPEKASSIEDFSSRDQRTIQRLDEIFWGLIPRMRCGAVLEEVKPIGGEEKAYAVCEIAERLNIDLAEVMYVGDSITDVESFRLVRKNNGLAVSFNGNEYAVREAEVAVLAEHTIVTSILAEVFKKHGKEGVIKLASEWSLNNLEKYSVSQNLIEDFKEKTQKFFIKVEVITEENRKELSEESKVFRKKVRGEKIGELG